MANDMVNVAVVYHMWPHYRLPVMVAMEKSDCIRYTFFGSGSDVEGIKHIPIASISRFRIAKFYSFRSLVWQPAALTVSFEKFDAIIYLANPNFVSTWIGALLAKVLRKPVLFWGHGWLKAERPIKRKFRNLFFGLSDKILVYNRRAAAIGSGLGYPSSKIDTIFNSLDVAVADRIFDSIENGTLATVSPRALFEFPQRPLIICTARITHLCRFDLLIEAAAILRSRDFDINILLVGAGPEEDNLQALSKNLGVNVLFFGPCYDESVLGQLIYHSDITVSPGKIGLTAMHSLMYGTPAITHGSLDDQMPEVEAIDPGRTGRFFERDSAEDLAAAIQSWLTSCPDRTAVRKTARAEIHEHWNPDTQARIIEKNVLEVLNRVAS